MSKRRSSKTPNFLPLLAALIVLGIPGLPGWITSHWRQALPPSGRGAEIRENVSLIQADTQRALDAGKTLVSAPLETVHGGAGGGQKINICHAERSEAAGFHRERLFTPFRATRSSGTAPVYPEAGFKGSVITIPEKQPVINKLSLGLQLWEDRYALRDSGQQNLWGDAGIFKDNPVIQRVKLEHTRRDSAAPPENIWQDALRKDLTISRAAALIIVLLVVLLTYLAVRRHARMTRVEGELPGETDHSKTALETRVEERTKELSALLEVARTVSSTLEIEPLLSLIFSQLGRVIEYSGAAVAVLEDGYLVFLDYQGPDPREQILGLKIPLDQPSGYQEVIKRGETVIIADLWSDSFGARSRDSAGEENRSSIHFKYARSWMGIPLIVKGRIIGVLRIDHAKPGRFSLQDATLVQAFANQAAGAIENARLYQQAQDLASLKERQRLARDLHDSVSQALYGISLGAQSARKTLEQKPYTPELLHEPLDYLVSLSGAALAEMRALIFELRPEALEKEGLVALLAQHAAAVRSRHKIEVVTDFSDEPEAAVETKEALLRVAQEAVNNAVKHARASTLWITLRIQEEFLLLEVRDNGQGFNPKVDRPGHIGLSTMRERAEAQGGRLEITSASGEGTRVRALLPYGGGSR